MIITSYSLERSDSLFSNRYFLIVPVKQQYEGDKTVYHFEPLTELGCRSYGSIVGPILTFLGYAFKANNEDGETIYLNKKSFCKYVSRMRIVLRSLDQEATFKYGIFLKTIKNNFPKLKSEQVESCLKSLKEKYESSNVAIDEVKKMDLLKKHLNDITDMSPRTVWTISGTEESGYIRRYEVFTPSIPNIRDIFESAMRDFTQNIDKE